MDDVDAAAGSDIPILAAMAPRTTAIDPTALREPHLVVLERADCCM